MWLRVRDISWEGWATGKSRMHHICTSHQRFLQVKSGYSDMKGEGAVTKVQHGFEEGGRRIVQTA